MNTPHYTWAESPIHEQIRKMNDTPTPDTDEHEFPCMTWALQDHPMVVRADFARKLERELTAVTEQRDEARFDLDFRRRLGDWQNKTIDDLTKQRDEAREILREIRDNEVNPEDEADRFLRDHVPSELSKVREQRDRLSEALANLVKANETWNQGMMDVIGRPPNWNDSYLRESKEALQSLPPKR
jgi:hypothetical protein